jgi:Putative zinc-finger
MTDRFTYDAAPYVLGALSDEERRDFERHLAVCPACTDVVAEFSGLPALLATVPEAEAVRTLDVDAVDAAVPAMRAVPDVGPTGPPSLLPSLLSAARRERRSRRWRTAAAGLAAASLVVIGTTVAVDQLRNERPASESGATQTVTFTAVGGQPIEATAVLDAQAWGTTIDMRCTYRGTPSSYGSSWYTLVATDKSGAVRDLSSWQVRPGEEVEVVATAPPRDQLASLEVVNAARNPVLHLDL